MSNGGAYLGMKAFIQSNRQIQQQLERDGIPGTGGLITCPIDGSPLRYNTRLHLWRCEMGNYETARGPRGSQGNPGAR